MKKIISVLLFIISLNITNSQIIDFYGFKSGISLSNVKLKFIKVNYEWDTDTKIGYNFSFYLGTNISENIDLVSEVGYSQKGCKYSFMKINEQGIKIGEIDNNNRFDYLTIKILTSYKMNFGIANPYMFIGPRLDINLGDRLEIIPVSFRKYLSNTQILNNTQIGISSGIGVKLKEILPYTILVEFNYDYDFGNSSQSEFIESKNYSAEFKLGLEF